MEAATLVPAANTTPLDRLRTICLALPDASERLSHGTPWWFVRDRRAFACYSENHHGDGITALWCDAPPGAQQAIVAADRERFFVPPYVGYRGWLGVRLDGGPDWNDVAAIVEQAHATAHAALAMKRINRR
jgi:hypothetical protein